MDNTEYDMYVLCNTKIDVRYNNYPLSKDIIFYIPKYRKLQLSVNTDDNNLLTIKEEPEL